MAKFETWLDMNLTLVDGGAVVTKVTLEGPDGTTWGTWSRDFPNLATSISGMLGSLREELPKGRHSAKLLAWADDGTQLSCFPITVTGSSEAAAEGAQNHLVAQRANALFLANVEKMQAGMMSMLAHTNEVASEIAEANRNLNADMERSRAERDEGRMRAIREEGRQRRLDQMADKFLPLIEIALGMLAERFADWASKQAEQAKLPANSTAPRPPDVQLGHAPKEPPTGGTVAEGTVAGGTTSRDESNSSRDSGGDSPPGNLGPDGSKCARRDGTSAAGGRDCPAQNEARKVTRRKGR